MKKTVLALSLPARMGNTTSVFAALPQNTRISTDATYAPFSSKDAKGDFVGFGIDLGNELCSRIKVKYVWVGSDFDSLILSLKAKKIDAIISSLSITGKRQQEIAFSDKLYIADSRLIAAKGSPIQPALEALKGKHIRVLQGSTQEAYANDRWRSQGVDVVAYQNQDLIYSDLVAGRLDATLQDEVAASEGFPKQPAGKGFAFVGPSVKDRKHFGDDTGIGPREGGVKLKAAFDETLGEIRKDGTYDKMARKYFDFNVHGD